jgi:SAM-dependent methyltransferase
VNYEESRYARVRWNTPLSESHAELLLDRLGTAESTVDIGCGWGELLLRAVARGGAGVGVDSDAAVLARGRQAAAERGLADRVEFVETTGEQWHGTAARAICIGSAHALGGATAALTALAEFVEPGGRLLFGDGYWAEEPTPVAVDIFGDDVLALPELLATAREAGWGVLHCSVADQLEWDDFESTHRAGRQEWLLANEDDPRADEVREWLESREQEYHTVYRGVLGLAYVVLARN